MDWDLLFFEIFKGLDDNNRWFECRLGFFLIDAVEYAFGLNNSIHFPLEVEILVAPDWLVVFDSKSVQLEQFHEHLGGELFIELELDFTVKKVLGELRW